MSGLNKSVEDEIRLLRPLGWRDDGHTGASHRKIVHPDYGTKTMPLSPSDFRWYHRHRQDVARLMGITRPELEVRMGIRQAKSSSPKRSRTRNHDGVHAHKLKLAGAGQSIPEPKPKREPEPDDPAEKSVENVRQAWERKRVRHVGLDLPARRAASTGVTPDSDEDDGSYPCRTCGAPLYRTGKRGHPRVYCDECKVESKRPTSTLQIELRKKTLRLLGDDPEATVRALIDIYTKGKNDD